MTCLLYVLVMYVKERDACVRARTTINIPFLDGSRYASVPKLTYVACVVILAVYKLRKVHFQPQSGVILLLN